MNEKNQEPTLEQLRALLSGHPDLLSHIKSEKTLDRASREKLMQLMDLCGLSIDQVDHSDPSGLFRGLKEMPARDTTAGKTDTHGQDSKHGPDYGEDDDYLPFQITIEAMGHKMHYTAFWEYHAAARVKRNKTGDDWIQDELTFNSTIKVLSYTDTPELDLKTSRRSLKKASPIDEIHPVLLDDPTIGELLPVEAYSEFMNQIQEELTRQIISEIKSSEGQAAKEDSPNKNPEPKKD